VAEVTCDLSGLDRRVVAECFQPKIGRAEVSHNAPALMLTAALRLSQLFIFSPPSMKARPVPNTVDARSSTLKPKRFSYLKVVIVARSLCGEPQVITQFDCE
jgi:hypothetical protein